MKNSSPQFEKLSNYFFRFAPVVILLFLFGAFLGFLHLKKDLKREIEFNLNSTTRVIWTIWNSVTIVHEETMLAIYERHILDARVFEILRRANSQNTEERARARAELFRYLSETYDHLREKYMIRQLHFHTPDNRSFLRFHAPEFYDDDLTPHRQTVVLTNKLKKPHISFETGRLITGYRYVFPIIDPEGLHLGSVELSRPFEAVRRYLAKIHPEGGYLLILRKDDVFPKLLEPYKKYYTEIEGLPGWVIEDPFRELPDSPPPLNPEQEKVLRDATRMTNFKEFIERKESGTIFVKSQGRVYKISAIKIFELGKENHTGVLLAVLPGEDISLIMGAHTSVLTLYVFASFILAVALFVFWYLALVIRRKTWEFETIVEMMGAGLILVNKRGIITFINDYGVELLKCERSVLLGRPVEELLPVSPEEKAGNPLIQALNRGEPFTGDEVFKCGEGERLVVHVISRPLKIDQAFEGNLILFFDISKRKKYEEDLLKASITDCLTGLFNRRFAEKELERAKALAERYELPFSVLMIDIDDFKKINDRFGHDVGDLVLKTLATILKHNCRESDVIARWGGEEFLVLLSNTGFEGAGTIAERLRKTVANLRVKDLPHFTISIGYTTYRKGEDIESLIKRVDSALYSAKGSGKNTCVGIP